MNAKIHRTLFEIQESMVWKNKWPAKCARAGMAGEWRESNCEIEDVANIRVYVLYLGDKLQARTFGYGAGVLQEKKNCRCQRRAF